MIDGISGRPAGLNGSPVRPDAPAAGTAAAAGKAAVVAAESPDRAELSDLATAARDASSAPVDKARVAEIRAAIANGSYKVDPEKIAAKMVELDLGWTPEGGAGE